MTTTESASTESASTTWGASARTDASETTDAPDLRRLVLNPALRVTRGSDDELVIRQGSRGRSSQRITDEARRGVLADLTFAFGEGARVADLEGPVPADLLEGLVERHVLISEEDASFAFLTAGLGVAPGACRLTCVAVVGTGTLAEVTARMVRDALPDHVAVLMPATPDALDDDDPADVVVAVADRPDTAFFFDVNEFALTTGVPWHAAHLDGTEAVVGPLYRPGATGCYHDFDVLDEAGRSMRVDHVFTKLTGTQSRGRVPLYAASMAASYLTTSLLQDAFGLGSYLEGALLRLDLDRLEVIRQQLSRLARCPACMEGRPDVRHPFV